MTAIIIAGATGFVLGIIAAVAAFFAWIGLVGRLERSQPSAVEIERGCNNTKQRRPLHRDFEA